MTCDNWLRSDTNKSYLRNNLNERTGDAFSVGYIKVVSLDFSFFVSYFLVAYFSFEKKEAKRQL